ncbi:translation initiation factor eIF2B subunit beta [Parasteatoda tepidariorum]|uniref:translation initiation factor eIF2B subunit beta n=1 Tax=Parasteatoda tepidariorum TaxID=114398 RepID=UPI00077FB7CB|nr:translation initiation factor eIF-2B subunit beta [Parasteatoda tepidariorum]
MESEKISEATSTESNDVAIEKFLKDLKEEKLKFSKEIACETVKLLEKIITNSHLETAKDIMELIKNVGKRLDESTNQATHTVVGNMVKRILKIIRDEYSTAMGKVDEYEQQESLQKMLVAEEQLDFTKHLDSLKKSISANLRELMEEFERSSQDIAAQSQEHIHFGEVILTFGHSRTVEKFLKKAVKRKCEVLVAEAFPSLGGHDLAKSLAESGIQTTLIQDAAIFALMSRVDKVIVGTHSVMANGGLKALCGTHALALAARHHSKPFIVLAPMFKLTPQYVTSSDQEGFNHMRAPEELIPFDDSALFDGVEVINPAFDYVPPELITLMISNMGGNAPSYVYRLLSEMYHPDDYSF